MQAARPRKLKPATFSLLLRGAIGLALFLIGGFFKGPVVSPGVIGLTPGQNLLIFATIFTFDR